MATVRFGVSLDSELLTQFDALAKERGYDNRSEAIRDLIRDALVQRQWEGVTGESAGTVTLVYDHHHSDLAQRLTAAQHDSFDVIAASLHIHLDHDNCLEVLVMRGPGDQIRTTAERLISTKGVKHGKLMLTTVGRDLK